MRVKRPMRPMRPQRRWRRSGQALVETALTAPILVMLLLGGAQVGQIAYDQVSLDTAAREGARAGVAAPNAAITSSGSNWYPGATSHTCTTGDFTQKPENPVCNAVLNSGGYLSSGTFTSNPCTGTQACVTISVRCVSSLSGTTPCTQLSSMRRPAAPGPIRLVGNTSPCRSGNQAEVDGTVSGVPSGQAATLNDTAGDTPLTNITGTYQYCVTATSQVTTETITATAVGFGCGGYSGTVTIGSAQKPIQHGAVYTGEDITLTANTCTTSSTTSSTSSTTSTGTSTSTSTSTSTTSTGTLSSGPSVQCTSQPIPDAYYFTVTVSYPAPVFVPFINNLFETSSGVRTISTSVTYSIDPCTMTNGA